MKNIYFKLVPNTGDSQIKYLFEFSGEQRSRINKRINFGKDNQPDYLLIEITINKNDTESYTDIFPINTDNDLRKKIGKRTCYDYSGITLTVWHKGKPLSWETYQEERYRP